MLRAPMPEAPVDEHGEPLSREDDIRPNRAATRDWDRRVHTEAQAPSVEGRPEAELGAGVSARVCHHDAPTNFWYVGPRLACRDVSRLHGRTLAPGPHGQHFGLLRAPLACNSVPVDLSRIPDHGS